MRQLTQISPEIDRTERTAIDDDTRIIPKKFHFSRNSNIIVSDSHEFHTLDISEGERTF